MKELREKGREALRVAWQKVNEGQLRGEDLLNPKDKANLALLDLSQETRDAVFGHGVASNIPIELLQDEEKRKDFPIDALVSILATGVVRGDRAPLSGGPNQNVFANAPFILLSNKGEELFETDKEGTNHLSGLRTILVNGQYEAMIDDLRRAFPWVSFRRSEEMNDAVFDAIEPKFVSYDNRIKEMARREFEIRSVKK